ncbi:MAG: hypothetical protein D6705_11230 [Deltaproteobacteria bacterium]|nr:MAG: hypothetical protein D6705_11230 [Deltaproteobacteria bacterium]
MRSTLILGTLAFAFAVGLGAGTARADDAEAKPCSHKTFKTKQVEAACKSGGQKAAKSLMKKVVKKAKAAGEKINCKTCHTSLKTFEYKPEAVEALKKWL